MTELYIDGWPIALPNDFEITFFVYNPFFTKKGEYTYDIDISLKSPQNAKIYKHIDRMHVEGRPTGRKAILIANSRVMVSGTEIVLKIEDDIAKIQIVAGNSELNYLSGGNKTIRSVDLGTIPDLTTTLALSTLNKKYPETNFVCCPIFSVYNEGIQSFDNTLNNEWYNFIHWDVRDGVRYEENATLVAQPYFLYYVQKICEALGYVVSENVLLNEEKYRSLILVNGVRTLNYNEMLPNITINDFLSEIEKFFNIIFVVNQQDSTVRILSGHSFYAENETIYIDGDKVIDSMEKNYDSDESLYLTYKNVSYKLPGNNFYKYSRINKDIVDRCEVITASTYDELDSMPSNSTDFKIYKITGTDLSFIKRLFPAFSGSVMIGVLDAVNQFEDILNEDSDQTTELNIIPAETFACSFRVAGVELSDGTGFTGHLNYVIPLASNTQIIDEEKGLNEVIQSGEDETGATGNNLYLAFYEGLIQYMLDKTSSSNIGLMGDFKYPMCTVYPYVVSREDRADLYKIADDTHTLALKGEYGLFNQNYNLNFNVDTDTEYVIKYMSDRLFNPMRDFVIDCKLYYCKYLKYKLIPSGIYKEVEGIFYPRK